MNYIFDRTTYENPSSNPIGYDSLSLILILVISGYIVYTIYKFFVEILKQRNELKSEIRKIDNVQETHNLEDDCPICHENFKNATELDCGHKFCAKCIMDYYITTKPNLSCPMCRKNIRLINVLNYDRSEESKPYMEMIVMFNHEHLNGYNYVNKIFYFMFFFLNNIINCNNGL